MRPAPTTRSASICAKQSTPSISRGPPSVSRACWPKASRPSAFYWIGSGGYGRSAARTHARRLPDKQSRAGEGGEWRRAKARDGGGRRKRRGLRAEGEAAVRAGARRRRRRGASERGVRGRRELRGGGAERRPPRRRAKGGEPTSKMVDALIGAEAAFGRRHRDQALAACNRVV